MADNVITNAGSGGATFVTAAFTWSGDSAHATGCFQGIISGSEGSWTFSPIVGGAGAVAAGVQRMTLASDDPAVAKLTTIDVDTLAIAVSAASIDGKITACNTGAVVLAAGTAIAGKVGIDQVTANANEVVTKTGSVTSASQSGTWNITNISGTVSLPTGAATSALQGGGLPAALGAGGGLKVDGSGTALPVSGTVAVTQATATNLKAQAEAYQGGAAVAAANALYVQAGTGATFKLASNSGVDVGDVDVLSVIPGTGATSLGKARKGAMGSTDTGVGTLAVMYTADGHTSDVSDGQFAFLSVTDFRELRTRDQRAVDLANCNAYTDYTAISNDTTGLANSTNHVAGAGALTFNKVDGSDNTVYGGVYRTFTAINLSEIFEAGGFVGMGIYLPSLSNVVNVFLRIGTDTSHYNCWTWPVADLTAATWLNLRKAAMSPDYSRNAGNGWNPAAIAYVAFGVEFSSASNTLSGIICDHVHIVGGRVTSSDINAAISSSVTTPNVNINRVGGTSTDTNNGAASAGTLRVTLANNSTGVLATVGTVTTVSAVTSITNALPAGTNAIGKLAANSGVDIGDVDVTSISAGTNTIGGVIAQASSSIVYDGTTACTVKRFMAVVDASGETVIAAPTGSKKIRVLSMSVFALSTTASTFYLETGTTNTDCFGTSAGPITLDMDGVGGPAGVVLPWNPGGWFQTADNDESVEVVMSSTEKMLFCGNYIEVA